MEYSNKIPVPSLTHNKYNFERLSDEGDSLFFNKDIDRIRRAARSYARYHGFKIVTRKEGDGVRIWRV